MNGGVSARLLRSDRREVRAAGRYVSPVLRSVPPALPGTRTGRFAALIMSPFARRFCGLLQATCKKGGHVSADARPAPTVAAKEIIGGAGTHRANVHVPLFAAARSARSARSAHPQNPQRPIISDRATSVEYSRFSEKTFAPL